MIKFVILTLCVMNNIVSDYANVNGGDWANEGDWANAGDYQNGDMSGEQMDMMAYSASGDQADFDMEGSYSASGEDFNMGNAASYGMGMTTSMGQAQDSQILTSAHTQFSKPVVTERRMSRPYVMQKIIQRPVIKRKIVQQPIIRRKVVRKQLINSNVTLDPKVSERTIRQNVSVKVPAQ